MPEPLLIENAHIVDPSQDLDAQGSLLVVDGAIAEIGKVSEPPSDCRRIDATGKHAFPGLIDACVFVGEPGGEHRETIASASRAAAKGGVTSFIMMPDTDPVIDDVSLVDFVTRAARDNALVRIYPSASITKGLAGNELTEFGLLQEAGAVMLTEGKLTVDNSLIFRRALTYARDFNMVVTHLTHDPDLSSNGVVNEGLLATKMGLPGIPKEAETIALDRDLRLAALTRGRYHAATISTAQSSEIIARSKADGNRVTCGTTINHLVLDESDIGRYRTYLRLQPPLRHFDDRQATIKALADGTVDIIVSAHDPHDVDEKRHPFAEAASGATGLETLFSAALRLYHEEMVSLNRLIEAMSTKPAEIFSLEGGTLKAGARADLVLADLNQSWTVREADLVSQSKNTPFEGETFQGQIVQTYVGGDCVYDVETAS